MDAKKLWVQGSLIFAWVLAASTAHAFVFSPMSVEFEPAGPGATRSFTVENDGDKPVAVEFAIYPRTQDIEGREPAESPSLADKRFVIYPPQTLLQPKEKRTLRVTWVGEAKLDKELPFRIIAEQLRLDTEKKKSDRLGGAMIDLLLKYKGALYVRPREAKSDLVLKGAEALLPGAQKSAKGKKSARSRKDGKSTESDGATEPKIMLVFENKGTAHQLLADVQLRVSVKGSELVLKPSDIPEVSSQNVLAGGVRRFEIPWPKGLVQGPVQVKLEWFPGEPHR